MTDQSQKPPHSHSASMVKFMLLSAFVLFLPIAIVIFAVFVAGYGDRSFESNRDFVALMIWIPVLLSLGWVANRPTLGHVTGLTPERIESGLTVASFAAIFAVTGVEAGMSFGEALVAWGKLFVILAAAFAVANMVIAGAATLWRRWRKPS